MRNILKKPEKEALRVLHVIVLQRLLRTWSYAIMYVGFY